MLKDLMPIRLTLGRLQNCGCQAAAVSESFPSTQSAQWPQIQISYDEWDDEEE